MLIKKAEKNLVDSINLIEQSDKFGFRLALDTVWPVGIHCPDRGINIMHLDMTGPHREYARKTKTAGSWNGSYWQSFINIYPSPEFESVEDASDFFIKLLEKPSRRDSYDSYNYLGYDFLPEQQPQRTDGIERLLHRICFEINLPNHTEKIKARYYIQESLGDLSKRIYFPPAPHNHWSNMPWIVKVAKEAMK